MSEFVEGFHLESMLATLDANANPTTSACAGVIRSLRAQLVAAEKQAFGGGPTLTHLWGQPVAEMRHALEFLEQYTGTTEIRASVKRLTLVLKGQRDLIASQAKLLNTLTAESKTWETLEEWLRASDMHLVKMSQEQGNAEPPPGWIVQLERDAMCGEVDVIATARGLTLIDAARAALAAWRGTT